jgi:hypothetical protein
VHCHDRGLTNGTTALKFVLACRSLEFNGVVAPILARELGRGRGSYYDDRTTRSRVTFQCISIAIAIVFLQSHWASS